MSKKPLQPSTVQKVLDSLKFGGWTALYDAIEDTCTQILSRLGNPDTPRRAIFLISDGNDNSSRIYPAKALEIAEGEGVAIFTLDIEQIESHGERFLKEASHDTGGQAIVSKKLGDGVTPLLNAVNAQWALGIMPPQASDQKRHSLTVKTSRKDVHLSAPANIFFH
jgi:Mg-chelatase subunit ChlD